MTHSGGCTCTACTQVIEIVPQTPVVIDLTQEPTYIAPYPDITNIASVGPQGPKGSKGDKGDKGDAADVSHTYTQSIPSDTWVIAHNLNFIPNVTVQDSAGTIIEGEITYTNSNNLTLTFNSAFSGYAYLS